MSGGPRTQYSFCYIYNNNRYLVPLYNTQNGFTTTGEIDELKWFVTYVDGRKLYIPLRYPEFTNSLNTVIDNKKYSFAHADVGIVNIRTIWSFHWHNVGPGPDYPVFSISVVDPSGCYQWSCTMRIEYEEQVAGGLVTVYEHTFTRDSHESWEVSRGMYENNLRASRIKLSFNFTDEVIPCFGNNFMNGLYEVEVSNLE